MKKIACVVLLSSAACGGSYNLLPDGGRPLQECSEIRTTVPVKVVDDQGQPVSGATVTAKNLGSGKTVTATTDGNGNTNALTQELGSGTVRVSATLSSRATGVSQVEFVCGQCNCSVDPQSLTLQLSP